RGQRVRDLDDASLRAQVVDEAEGDDVEADLGVHHPLQGIPRERLQVGFAIRSLDGLRIRRGGDTAAVGQAGRVRGARPGRSGLGRRPGRRVRHCRREVVQCGVQVRKHFHSGLLRAMELICTISIPTPAAYATAASRAPGGRPSNVAPMIPDAPRSWSAPAAWASFSPYSSATRGTARLPASGPKRWYQTRKGRIL